MARTYRKETPVAYRKESKATRKIWNKKFRNELRNQLKGLRDLEDVEDLPELPNKTSGWMTH